MFGTRLEVAEYIFQKCFHVEKLSEEQHLLYVLHFLRHYETKIPGATAANLSDITHRKWVKTVLYHLHETLDEIHLNDRFDQEWPTGIFQCCLLTIDSTECPVGRSTDYEVQQTYYSGKKKTHWYVLFIV